MNKTSIDWATHSLNPISGCKHGCKYCYARGIAERFAGTKAYPNGFEPTFHPERLDELKKLKKPAHIFMVSMGDMFGQWVPDHWAGHVLNVIAEYPQHTFTILTKNPARLKQWEFSDNCIVGTSITGLMDDAEVGRLQSLSELSGVRKVVSMEPMLHKPEGKLFCQLDEANIDWLIIGGQTGRNPFKPKQEWIDEIITPVRRWGIPVFVKDNCGYPLTVREYPAGVPHDE